MAAAEDGNLEKVKHLLEVEKADMDEKIDGGGTAVSSALLFNRPIVLEYLIKKGADLSVKAWIGSTLTNGRIYPNSLLYSAALLGYFEIAKLLIELGKVDVNDKTNEGGESALLAAATNKGIEVVKLLLRNNAAIDDTNNKGETALQRAADIENVDVIKYLLNQGANVEKKDKTGKTPLIAAALNDKFSAMKILIENGRANINAKDNIGRTALYLSTGNVQTVKYLLQNGAEIDFCESGGRSPLWTASHLGHVKSVKLLIERGANVELTDSISEASSLLVASGRGMMEVVKLLIKKGKANLNAKNKKDQTALYLAAALNKVDIMEYLIIKGANVNEACHLMYTPLMIASERGYVHAVKCLLQNGADVGLKKKDGLTTLMIACRSGYLNVVKTLIESGKIDQSITDFHGRTAKDIAKEKKHKEIFRYLEDNFIAAFNNMGDLAKVKNRGSLSSIIRAAEENDTCRKRTQDDIKELERRIQEEQAQLEAKKAKLDSLENACERKTPEKLKEIKAKWKETESLKKQIDDLALSNLVTCNICKESAKGKLIYECGECGNWICESCNQNSFETCPMCRTSLQNNPLRKSQVLKRI